jgi:predicted nuclease with TOPRIM domain
LKSKKFDAAEKHFYEKELKLKQQVKHYEERDGILINENERLSKENRKLQTEVSELKDKYNKLLEYSKLSDVDIKNALKRDQSVNNLSTFMDIMARNRI